MNKALAFLVLLFVAGSCHQPGQVDLQSPDTLKSKDSVSVRVDTAFVEETNVMRKVFVPGKLQLGPMLMVSAGQTSPYTTVEINGCQFNLVTEENDTNYLATSDLRFQTPEGYKVGTALSELSPDIQKELTKEPGWGYYYKLPSGWTLGFCEGSSCTDTYPTSDSKVKWLFKRQ